MSCPYKQKSRGAANMSILDPSEEISQLACNKYDEPNSQASRLFHRLVQAHRSSHYPKNQDTLKFLELFFLSYIGSWLSFHSIVHFS